MSSDQIHLIGICIVVILTDIELLGIGIDVIVTTDVHQVLDLISVGRLSSLDLVPTGVI